MSEEWANVRITIIDVNGPNEVLIDSIRAAANGRLVYARDSVSTAHSVEQPRTIQLQSGSQQQELGANLLPSQIEPSEVRSEGKKKISNKKKPDTGQSQLRAARKTKLNAIAKASTFDDHERYSAAIGKDGAGVLDLAALVTRLAQEKFGFDEGLSPFEVRTILKNRFYVNIGDRTMEETMKKAPSTFFAVGPADFDQRAKLYRPMKDCLKRVEELLAEFDSARIEGEQTKHAAATASR